MLAIIGKLRYAQTIVSTSETRATQYGLAGTVMAQTATRLGAHITPILRHSWEDTTARLALADDISEVDPTFAATSLLNVLSLPDTPPLYQTATNLLDATRSALAATDIRAHFAARRAEALHTAYLLRDQSPEPIRLNIDLWGQLGELVVLATHFDDFLDCRVDSELLPQFSPGQLMRSAAIRMLGSARRIRPQTALACALACHETGVDRLVFKKLAKPFRTPEPKLIVESV